MEYLIDPKEVTTQGVCPKYGCTTYCQVKPLYGVPAPIPVEPQNFLKDFSPPPYFHCGGEECFNCLTLLVTSFT